MSNDHHSVEKRFKPRMKINEAIQQTGKTSSNVIIEHASTTNASKTTPQELCKEVVEALDEIQENNPRSKIVFSAVFRRSYSHELNAKITQLNDLLEEELPQQGF